MEEPEIPEEFPEDDRGAEPELEDEPLGTPADGDTSVGDVPGVPDPAREPPTSG